MEPASRDTYNNFEEVDHVWVSVAISRRDDNGGRERRQAAIEWANEEFGNEFFYFGGKMFFASEQHLVQFKLRWL